MSDPNFVILYVKNPATSADFYQRLLGKAPVEASPNFVMFALANGLMLGLWAAANVEPAVTAAAGGGELAVSLETKAAVTARHQAWVTQGLPILQAPTDMDFGYTFLALDPDGHRLRVFAPAA